jgi:hypothetical protein
MIANKKVGCQDLMNHQQQKVRGILGLKHTMKIYDEVHVKLCALSSALDGGECSALRSGCFGPRGNAPCLCWLGGWEIPISGLKLGAKRFFRASVGN